MICQQKLILKDFLKFLSFFYSCLEAKDNQEVKMVWDNLQFTLMKRKKDTKIWLQPRL